MGDNNNGHNEDCSLLDCKPEPSYKVYDCGCGPIVFEEDRKKYGLPRKSGISIASAPLWDSVKRFLESKVWLLKEPALESDLEDDLLKDSLPFGEFMMGFDFHVAGDGSSPKLIEVNTNAGGLATVMSLGCCQIEKDFLKEAFASAVKDEHRLGVEYFSKRNLELERFWERRGKESPQVLVIVDTDCEKQFLFPEMKLFASFLLDYGIQAFVVSPEELFYRRVGEKGEGKEKGEGEEKEEKEGKKEKEEEKEGEKEEFALFYKDLQVDFVYNRLTDFRFEQKQHLPLRQAAIEGKVVISPHPATYTRTADKRNLVTLSRFVHSKKETQTEENTPFSFPNEGFLEGETFGKIEKLIPQTWIMDEKPIEEWQKLRKRLVFKPADGNGSRGVYRGDRISNQKLKTLDVKTTIVQELCPPGVDPEDGTKWDFRVYSHSDRVLGLATRHFQGQVMEMKNEKSGFRRALPENDICLMQTVSRGGFA